MPVWMSSGEINYEYVYDTVEKITELGMQNSNAKMWQLSTKSSPANGVHVLLLKLFPTEHSAFI